MTKKLRAAAVAAFALVLMGGSLHADRDTARHTGLNDQVRHELAMLPYYSVFDNLGYEVNGDTVKLTGEVTRPTLKSDAEAVVKRLEGVSKVDNQIKVLPLSSFDNQVRRRVYYSLFNSNSPLFHYAVGSDSSIHIIVDNGRVTLKGMVSSDADKNMAGLFANQVFGVFSVSNDLTVTRKGA